MAKLPKIYQNKITKEIHNNKKVYYGKTNSEVPEQEGVRAEEDIEDFIDEIFALPTYSFNIPLTIYTKEKTYNTSLIAKTKGSVITFDNDVIPLSDITRIEKR